MALLAQTQRASADTPFSSFAFQAGGSPTARTMPERLGEIKNVKDFGAVGNGTADDTAAIQSAIDWTANDNKGQIFFPPGNYVISSPLTLNAAAETFILTGCGSNSQITGNFGDWLIRRSNATNAPGGIRVVEKLNLYNFHPLGKGIQILGQVGATIRDCQIQANQCIDVTLSSQAQIENCGLLPLAGWPTGSRGIICGGNSAIRSCDITHFEEGVRAYGPGLLISGGRFEVNKTAMMLGKDGTNATNGLQGATIIGGSFEANDTAIYCNAIGSTLIAGWLMQGTPGSPSSGSLNGIVIPNSGCTDSVFSSLSLAGGFANYCFSLGNNLARTSFIGCKGANNGIGVWSISQGCGAQFLGCNIPAPANQAFANAPPLPAEGDLWVFTDSNTATFGAQIAGSGTNRVVGRYSSNTNKWYVAALAT